MKNKIREGGAVALLIIFLLAILYGISWIATCGVIKLITLCFNWKFKWSIATGIWLILCLAKNIFNVTANNNNKTVI